MQDLSSATLLYGSIKLEMRLGGGGVYRPLATLSRSVNVFTGCSNFPTPSPYAH